MPPFRFLLSTDHTPVVPETPLWMAPLPTSRGVAGGPSGDAATNHDGPVSYGAYFGTLQEALAADNCAALREAIGRTARTTITPEQIESVEIQLLKHGHFYHPARVVVFAAGIAHSMALNLAVTADGIALLPRETAALTALARQGGLDNLPRVLAQGECVSAQGQVWRWFLAPWFEGFHEFHLTGVPGGRQAVTVWSGTPQPTLLSAHQTDALLEGAARLLATAFNPHTLAHIFPWHHAAGDFVVRMGPGGQPQVRLITVRDYQALLPPIEADDAGEDDAFLERLLYALLLLAVQVALRLRVDRLDGVGEIAVHPVCVLTAICRGYLAGVDQMCRRWDLPRELSLAVRAYLGTPSLDDLNQINASVVGGFAPGSEEREALGPCMEEHAKALHGALQSMASAVPSH